jgi:NAD(P)-dependent dehydrogenase (short-subunit alcohol dehydrogenase family)
LGENAFNRTGEAMDKRFKGKVVIVTGASAGIGQAAAIEFAKEGARVAVVARRAAEGEATVRQIRAVGGDAMFIKADVAKASEVEAMVATTVTAWGQLDCAFNNAGIGGDALIPTAQHTEANWDAVMAINLKGVFLCMKYQIPEMLKRGRGAIVNNSSVFGLIGSTAGHAPYAASKHGVIGLTKSAAIEYAKLGIRVNALCPGWTHSEMVDGALEAHPEVGTKITTVDVPMARIADPIEIARVAVWLCSDDAGYVTGQAFAPDGGWTAQ